MISSLDRPSRDRALELALDAPPAPEFATNFMHEVGETAAGIPIASKCPSNKSRRRKRRFGARKPPRNCACRSGARARPSCNISRSAKARASTRLIAGKTGSGKSTLFHVMITNLALWCSPEQVEFYLVDFKKGVEFKCYAHQAPAACARGRHRERSRIRPERAAAGR